jgi:hypothetical protein
MSAVSSGPKLHVPSICRERPFNQEVRVLLLLGLQNNLLSRSDIQRLVVSQALFSHHILPMPTGLLSSERS